MIVYKLFRVKGGQLYPLVNRILTDAEVAAINKRDGVYDLPRAI